MESYVKLIVPIVLTALVTWFFARPKTKADIGQLEASTQKTEAEKRKTEAETLYLTQDKIEHWIEKFSQVKMKAIELEGELSDAKQELEKCLKYRTGCAEFKEKIFPLLERIESILRTLDEDAPIISELRQLRKELNQ